MTVIANEILITALDLLGPKFSIEVMRLQFCVDQLFDSELLYLKGATRKRQAEFATARVCARAALLRLGIAPQPLVPYPDRSPRWPDGVVGSITHNDDYCLVAVTISPIVRSVGLDIESDIPLDQDVEDLAMTKSEKAMHNGSCLQSDVGWSKDLFCAKEAIFKCQYLLTKSFLDFQDIELRYSHSSEAWAISKIHANKNLRNLVTTIECKVRRAAGFVIAAAILH